MDTLFSILHVVGAVFIIGPMAVMPMIALRSVRSGDTIRAASSATAIRLLSYLSLIVVVTGFGVMGMADASYGLSMTTPWILGSLTLYFIALALTMAVVVPALMHSGGTAGPKIYVRVATGSSIATLGLIGTVALMVWKP